MTSAAKRILDTRPVAAAAPCRVDLGGTLDIKTFFLPLAVHAPATFNIALGLPTRVCLYPYQDGYVKVTSRGFESVAFPLAEAPFDHPLGLIFAILSFFNMAGIHVDIDSTSPPRAALGGSSAAAVALIAALQSVQAACEGHPLEYDRNDIVLTAHAVEESVASVPCGLQDHLAAAFGGVNAWYWKFSGGRPAFIKKNLLHKTDAGFLEDRFLLAYCGMPHESKDINGKWVRHFLKGENRGIWQDIIETTESFIQHFAAGDTKQAIAAMNREVDLRKQMTPEVFDDMGNSLVACARACQCGARFTGAGGGGCVWALGEPGDIDRLRREWQNILSRHKQACLLDARVDWQGATGA